MDNRLLSYDALKSVLKHMEANKRLQISAACPSLQKVEKTVPLTINHLSFVSPYEVQINDKVYRFGVIREYREEIPPKCIEKTNNDGGLNCDVDEWGFDIKSNALFKTAGDIVIGELLEPYEEVYDDDTRKQLEKQIQIYKNKFENELGDVGLSTDGNWIVDLLEAALLPYQCRENNEKPAHDCYIQLSFKSDQPPKTVRIGRVKYTRKLYEAMKSFMNSIFGGRHSSLRVRNLKVDCPNQIVRLPQGIKLEVIRLEDITNVERTFDALLPVLSESCLPIKSIKTYRINGLDENSAIQKAEELTFHCIWNSDLFDFLQSLSCLKVNYFEDNRNFDIEKVLIFIKYLMESDRRIGTTYRIGVINQKIIIELFDMVEEQLKDKVIIDFDEKLLILSMVNTKQLQISYRKSYDRLFYDYDGPSFILKIEIVANQITGENWT